jgi:hypothetical protein
VDRRNIIINKKQHPKRTSNRIEWPHINMGPIFTIKLSFYNKNIIFIIVKIDIIIRSYNIFEVIRTYFFFKFFFIIINVRKGLFFFNTFLK